MRKLLALVIGLSAAIAGLAQAAQPGEAVHDFRDMPVITRGAKPSPSQVREAIVRAGEQMTTIGGSSWKMAESEPGELVGSLSWGQHAAEVTITYSPERYSVVYRGSTNLGYDPAGPSIHPTYNKLVRALSFRIGATLNAVQGDPDSVIPVRASRGALATRRAGDEQREPAGIVAVHIWGGPETRRQRAWPHLLAEWQNHIPGAVRSVGAELIAVREGEPVSLGKHGTMIAVEVDHFRFVSPARRYRSKSAAAQDGPGTADLDVKVQFLDLMTGAPVGAERSYTESARNSPSPQTTNLQVRNMARQIMLDWQDLLASGALQLTPAIAARTRASDLPASEGARAEVSFWESVRDSKDPAELRAYLERYPNGIFAPLARSRLTALGK